MSLARAPPPPGRLGTAKSEGSVTMRKREVNGQEVSQQQEHRKEEHQLLIECSSDDSGPEDEHIVRIDSLSRLSLNQAP